MTFFDDYPDEMPEELESFAKGVRAAATRMPDPSPALAQLLITGVSSPQPKRSMLMKVKTYLAGLGLAAKVMLGAGVAAAATTGAGAAGVLPSPVQHVVAETVGTVTPFNLPDPMSDKGAAAAGDHANDHVGEPPATTTTTVGGHQEHHDGDGANGVGVEPTTSTTAPHSDEHHDPVTTSTTIHEEHHDTTTTAPTTPTTTHGSDNNNPESISLHCTSAHEPNSVHCTWTASTSPDHVRYALLRTNNMNSEGRVVTQTEHGLDFTDTNVNGGWAYTYRIVSLRADGSTESHSNGVTLTCC